LISPHLLRIESSYSYRTYCGCLEGAPSVAIMMGAAKYKAKELYGDGPLLVIDPTIKDKHLPTWTHIIFARGPAKDEENDGSHLCVCWWSEFEPDTKRVLDAVDWHKHAKDFQY
jgi:hypothetical protein